MRSTTLRTAAGISAGTILSFSSSTKNAASSPVVETMRIRSPGRATFGSKPVTMDSGSVMSVPPSSAGFRDLKVTSGVDFFPLILIPDGGMSRQRPGLVLGENTGDVIVHHHDFIDMSMPLLRKMPMVAEPHPTRMRCSSTPLTTGALPASITTCAPPSISTSTALVVAQIHHHLAGDAAFLLAAAGEMVHPAQ